MQQEYKTTRVRKLLVVVPKESLRTQSKNETPLG